MGLLDFNGTFEISFAVHLKHSSFWTSADGKPISNHLAHEMSCQCMLALSISIQGILTGG
jgi:hypothetical protein